MSHYTTQQRDALANAQKSYDAQMPTEQSDDDRCADIAAALCTAFEDFGDDANALIDMLDEALEQRYTGSLEDEINKRMGSLLTQIARSGT